MEIKTRHLAVVGGWVFHCQEGKVGVENKKKKKRKSGLTPVLDSGGGISGKLAKTPGPFSYQGSEVPDMAIPSTPSRKTLLVLTPLPSGSDSTFKLLQECYEACRTWGSSSGPPLPGWRRVGAVVLAVWQMTLKHSWPEKLPLHSRPLWQYDL